MDFKQMREAAGLTVAQAAEKARYGKGTIADLENHGMGSDRLKAKLLEIYGYENRAGISQYPEAARANKQVDLTDAWRLRAIRAENTAIEAENAISGIVARLTEITKQLHDLRREEIVSRQIQEAEQGNKPRQASSGAEPLAAKLLKRGPPSGQKHGGGQSS